MALAVDVSCGVFGWPPEFDEGLFQVASFAGVHHNCRFIEPRAEQRCDLLAAENFLENGNIDGLEDESVGRIVGQLQAAVACHRFSHVEQERVGNRIARVTNECVDDLLGVVTGCSRVPQSERSQPVGVDVLRGPFEFSEGCYRLAAIDSVAVLDFQEKCLVALDDQWSVGHAAPPMAESSPASRRARSSMLDTDAHSWSACAPSPTAPSPSSVGTPAAAVKFPSLAPPTA